MPNPQGVVAVLPLYVGLLMLSHNKKGEAKIRHHNETKIKQRLSRYIGHILWALSLLLPLNLQAQPKLVLSNGEWAPYNSESLPYYGYASHVVSEAFAEVGIEVEYCFYENAWMRAYEVARRGHDELGHRVDGSAVWLHTEEREAEFYYSDPVITEHHLLFHLQHHPLEWHTITDLKGKLIGAPLHMVMPTLEQAQQAGLIDLIRETESYALLFKMLSTRSIDAVVMDEQVGRYYLHINQSDQDNHRIVAAPTKIETRQYHLILTRSRAENAELMAQFNLGLKRLKEKGKLQAMYQALLAGEYFTRQ